MKFQINYRVGQSRRTDYIMADNLDEAVNKADQRHPSWEDVLIINKQEAV